MSNIPQRRRGRQTSRGAPHEDLRNEHEELAGQRLCLQWRGLLLMEACLEEDAPTLPSARRALDELYRVLGRYAGRFRIVGNQLEAWYAEHRRLTLGPVASILAALRTDQPIANRDKALAILARYEKDHPGALDALANVLWVATDSLQAAIADVLPTLGLKEHGNKDGARRVFAILERTSVRTLYRRALKENGNLTASVWKRSIQESIAAGEAGAWILPASHEEVVPDRKNVPTWLTEVFEAQMARLETAEKTADKKRD